MEPIAQQKQPHAPQPLWCFAILLGFAVVAAAVVPRATDMFAPKTFRVGDRIVIEFSPRKHCPGSLAAGLYEDISAHHFINKHYRRGLSQAIRYSQDMQHHRQDLPDVVSVSIASSCKVALISEPSAELLLNLGRQAKLGAMTEQAWQLIPGIGPAIAGNIEEERQRRGGFQYLRDLLDVSGIGPKRLAVIARYVRES